MALIKTLKYLTGLGLAVIMVVVGFSLTNLFEHGFLLVTFTISVPVIGLLLLKKQKEVAIGLLLSSILLFILGAFFIIASSLH